MNISEANAVIRVLRRFGVVAPHRNGVAAPEVDDQTIEAAVALLCEKAGKALQMTYRPSDDLSDWLHAVDSDGAAQEVCRALAEHERHGGAIPWPKVRKPYDDWKQLRSAVTP